MAATFPRLKPLWFFLWGYLKASVFSPLPKTIDDLKRNIEREIEKINENMLENVFDWFKLQNEWSPITRRYCLRFLQSSCNLILLTLYIRAHACMWIVVNMLNWRVLRRTKRVLSFTYSHTTPNSYHKKIRENHITYHPPLFQCILS